MTTNTLLIVLPLVTFAAVLAFAYVSRRRTEQRMKDPNAPKSSLAKDG